jgi:serine/threonine protein phosphatase 1
MISDIHGCWNEFNRLLIEVGFDPSKDQLILLGDYVDRGPSSKEVVEAVKELVGSRQTIALKGNHDQRFVDFILQDSTAVQLKFLEHGGVSTLHSYCGLKIDTENAEMLQQAKLQIRENYLEHLQFLDSLPLYHEDPQHIYVHAGLNPLYLNWREQPAHDFMYIKGEFHQSKPLTEKKVIFGHTRTVDLHGSPSVWFGEGKIGIDGGCAFGEQLNGLIYENGFYRAVHVKAS